MVNNCHLLYEQIKCVIRWIINDLSTISSLLWCKHWAYGHPCLLTLKTFGKLKRRCQTNLVNSCKKKLLFISHADFLTNNSDIVQLLLILNLFTHIELKSNRCISRSVEWRKYFEELKTLTSVHHECQKRRKQKVKFSSNNRIKHSAHFTWA